MTIMVMMMVMTMMVMTKGSQVKQWPGGSQQPPRCDEKGRAQSHWYRGRIRILKITGFDQLHQLKISYTWIPKAKSVDAWLSDFVKKKTKSLIWHRTPNDKKTSSPLLRRKKIFSCGPNWFLRPIFVLIGSIFGPRQWSSEIDISISKLLGFKTLPFF